MRILAPLGVLLPSGLGLKIDAADMGRAGFVRCLPNGCVAEVILEDKLLTALAHRARRRPSSSSRRPRKGSASRFRSTGSARGTTRCRSRHLVCSIPLWQEGSAKISTPRGPSCACRPGQPAVVAPRSFALSARQPLVLDPVVVDGVGAEAADLVGLVVLEVALEPLDMAVALEGEDVRREAVEEHAVVAR